MGPESYAETWEAVPFLCNVSQGYGGMPDNSTMDVTARGKMTLIFSYICSPSNFSLLFLTFFDVATIFAEVSDPNVCDNIDRRAGMYAGRRRSSPEMHAGIS